MEETGAHPEFDRRRWGTGEQAGGQPVKCPKDAAIGQGHRIARRASRPKRRTNFGVPDRS